MEKDKAMTWNCFACGQQFTEQHDCPFVRLAEARARITELERQLAEKACPVCSLVCNDCGCPQDEHYSSDAVLECAVCTVVCSGEFSAALSSPHDPTA